jgi:hypothetical protein
LVPHINLVPPLDVHQPKISFAEILTYQFSKHVVTFNHILK